MPREQYPLEKTGKLRHETGRITCNDQKARHAQAGDRRLHEERPEGPTPLYQDSTSFLRYSAPACALFSGVEPS